MYVRSLLPPIKPVCRLVDVPNYSKCHQFLVPLQILIFIWNSSASRNYSGNDDAAASSSRKRPTASNCIKLYESMSYGGDSRLHVNIWNWNFDVLCRGVSALEAQEETMVMPLSVPTSVPRFYYRFMKPIQLSPRDLNNDRRCQQLYQEVCSLSFETWFPSARDKSPLFVSGLTRSSFSSWIMTMLWHEWLLRLYKSKQLRPWQMKYNSTPHALSICFTIHNCSLNALLKNMKVKWSTLHRAQFHRFLTVCSALLS